MTSAIKVITGVADVKTAQALLGHASATMMLDVSAKFLRARTKRRLRGTNAAKDEDKYASAHQKKPCASDRLEKLGTAGLLKNVRFQRLGRET